MKKRTKENVHAAFVGEAKAYFRLLAFAEKAEAEEEPQVALLFRAIAEAEKIHAMRHLGLVRDIVVKDTDTNLETSFQKEKSVSENIYPDLIKAAEEDGEKATAIAFSQARDAEAVHMKLYERAIYHLINDTTTAYHVCEVCGYVTDKKVPKACPVCAAHGDKFRTVE